MHSYLVYLTLNIIFSVVLGVKNSPNVIIKLLYHLEIRLDCEMSHLAILKPLDPSAHNLKRHDSHSLVMSRLYHAHEFPPIYNETYQFYWIT